jgi:hypothetical protein
VRRRRSRRRQRAHVGESSPPSADPARPPRRAGGLDAPANAGLKLTAHALAGLAGQLGLRLDTFSLGPASRLLGAPLRVSQRDALG